MKWRVESGKLKVESGRGKVLRFPLSTFHFLLLILLVSSCTIRKKFVMPVPPVGYQWMTAKINGELNGSVLNEAERVKTENGAISFSGSIRMQRDSAIWVSASAVMGMESLRTLITQDSVIVVNRMDQTYLAEPLSEVAEKLNLPITLQESQAFLLGNGTGDHLEFNYGPYLVKIWFSDIQWDKPTTFPIKINKKYERMKL